MSANPNQIENDIPESEGDNVWQRLQIQMEKLDSENPGITHGKELGERLAERAKTLRQRMERPGAGESRITFLAFNKKQERYGISLDEVAAVEALDHFTPVPNAPNFIRGVTPWRGAILSLVDLGRMFGRPESGIADLRACVIVESGVRRIAVVALEVEEIFSVPKSELAEVPDLPGEIEPEWVVGVHDQNRLILRMSEIVKGISNFQQP